MAASDRRSAPHPWVLFGWRATPRGDRALSCYAWWVSNRPHDTSPEAWAIVEAGIRAMTPRQRVERAASLTVMAHTIALSEIRRRYPEDSPREHKLRLAARIIDPAVMKAAFDWPKDAPPGEDGD